MNTTFTSNGNKSGGHVRSNRKNELDYSERSGCGGYALLFVLIAIAIGLFTFIATLS